jgi:hypothetical protein
MGIENISLFRSLKAMTFNILTIPQSLEKHKHPTNEHRVLWL